MRLNITLILICLLQFANSQIDTLNKLNSKGKKNGYWLRYLDNKLIPTDSATSFFYGYEYYDNGEKILVFHSEWFKKDFTPVFNGTIPQKGKPVLIDGTFRWYHRLHMKDSAQYTEETYKGGFPTLFISTARHGTDSIYNSEYIDFTIKYNNIPLTYYIEMDTTFGRKKYYYRKGKKGWDAYKIE